MNGVTIEVRIGNEYVRGLTMTMGYTHKKKLRRFRYDTRRKKSKAVRMVLKMNIEER